MHKIALNVFGRIGRVLYAGAYALHTYETKIYDKSVLSPAVINLSDNQSLIKIYKNIQHKYYPEKDIYTKIIQ